MGTATSLSEGAQTFALLGQGEDVLILCPGPNISLCVQALPRARRVYLLHVPEFTEQMPQSWTESIPSSWRIVSLTQTRAMLHAARVLHYLPASRLFPSIYAPLLASLYAPTLGQPRRKTILLPSPAHGLIAKELSSAAHCLGYHAQHIPANLSAPLLRQWLEREHPALFLSINFHGLDRYGEHQSLLEAADVPVVVWCVDNPCHLLSNQKNQLWKRLILLVSDDWFVKPLRELGARVEHLPLGTDSAIFAPQARSSHEMKVCFVGRSQFPDRDHFFAACSVPAELMREAETKPGRQAHFGWWRDKLAIKTLWPGQDVRAAGLGAEQASAHWRIRCLTELAQSAPIDIVGDAHWKELVPPARVHPPVDYYHGLAEIYGQASFSLNLTSLLLPHGLTQRHFDTWVAGGFLLTDNTPGLRIFPNELCAPITFTTPEHAVELVRTWTDTPHQKDELRHAWHALITEQHTYVNRLQTILTCCAQGLLSR